MSSAKKSVLIVDNMFPILDIFQKVLTKYYDVVITTSLDQAKQLCMYVQFDYVFTDLNLGSDSTHGGYDLIRLLTDQNFQGKIILMSGYVYEVSEDIKKNIHCMLVKPFHITDVLKIMNK